MSNRLGGFQGTSYLGTNANQPSNVTEHTRNPDQYDNKNVSIGDQWVNTSNLTVWSLVSLQGNSTSKGQLATWIQMGGSASTTTYVTDAGSATESGGMIDIFGGPNINTSGAAATVTVSLNQNLVSLGSVEMEDLIVNNSATLTFLGEGILSTDSSGVIGVTDGNDGEILIASTAGTPQWANITAGANITITNGPNSIEIAASGDGDVGTINGDIGSATGTVLTLTGGTTGLIFTGAVSTLTMSGTVDVSHGGTGANSLTGVLIGNGTAPITGNPVTNHNVLIGGVSNAITSLAPSVTVGIPLVSQGSSADPAFSTAVVAGGGTGATTLTSNGILIGHGTSPVTAIAAGTDGQLPIGRTGNTPVMANLTEGTGISITNGSGSITISATAGSGSWILLETKDMAGLTTYTFSSGISATYSNYVLIGNNINVTPGTNSVLLQYSSTGGSTFVTTNYESLFTILNSPNPPTTSTSGVVITPNFGTTGRASYMIIYIYGLPDATGFAPATNGTMTGNHTRLGYSGSYYNGTPTSFNAFRVNGNGNTFFKGVFSLYGIVK